MGCRSLAMSAASFCRLASAVRCCRLAVAEGALDGVSSLMATVVSQYCRGKGNAGGRARGWAAMTGGAAGDPGCTQLAGSHPLLYLAEVHSPKAPGADLSYQGKVG